MPYLVGTKRLDCVWGKRPSPQIYISMIRGRLMPGSHVWLALGVSSLITESLRAQFKAIGLLWDIKEKYVKRKCSYTCNFTANLVAAELPLILV